MKLRLAIALVAVAAFGVVPASAAVGVGTMPTKLKIAFTSKADGEADVYSMNASGTGVLNLTHDKTVGVRADVEPVWSPDGRYVAFERQYAKGGADLMVVDASGGIPWPLTKSGPGATWNCHPAWAASGVVYFTSNRDGNFDLYSVAVNGGKLTQLTKTEPPAQNLTPAVSPDGTAVVFSRSGEGPLGLTGLLLLRLDTGKLVRVTAVLGGRRDTDPAWSPDGGRIAFASDRAGSNDLWLVDVDGKNLLQLTSEKSSETHPSFSPDGTRLVFAGDRSGATEIYSRAVIQPWPESTQLTFDKAAKGNPVWQLSTVVRSSTQREPRAR
jgi:TolB protein